MNINNIEKDVFVTISFKGKLTGNKQIIGGYDAYELLCEDGATKYVTKDALIASGFTFKDAVDTITLKNKTELIKEFTNQLPYMINNVIELKYNELPDYGKLFDEFKNGDLPKNKTQFEKTVRYGQERVLRGYFFIGDDGEVASRHDYLLFKDCEDEYKVKMIDIKRIFEFTFKKIYKIN